LVPAPRVPQLAISRSSVATALLRERSRGYGSGFITGSLIVGKLVPFGVRSTGHRYAERQNRRISDTKINSVMTWSEPMRDAKIAREQAIRVLRSGKVCCVWTGRALSVETLDVDHCFPWAAWSCGDLWNLLPAHREVNQTQKRNKLPGTELLRSARDRIEEWWDKGYLHSDNSVLAERFFTEANATLPMIECVHPCLADVFAALNLQQIRLKQDQQIPEWEPHIASK
jgi:hypothetical protein